MSSLLQKEIHEYALAMSQKGEEQVYYKAIDLENWVASQDGRQYSPGLCCRYLVKHKFPIGENQIRDVFNDMKRCEPLRSHIETFARSFFFDQSPENTDHLNALSVLVDKYPNEPIYKKQLEEERKRLFEYPTLKPVFSPAPLRRCIISDVYEEYEEAIAFLVELDNEDFPYDVIEQRFNMWREEVVEQRVALQTKRKSSYKRGYDTYRNSHGGSYIAGYNSKN